MKTRKLKSWLSLSLAVAMLLTACQSTPAISAEPSQSNQNEPLSPAEPANPDEALPPLHLDYFDTAKITHADAWDENEEAVAEWAKYVYQEFGVSEASAAYISGNVGLSSDFDNGCIDVRRYRIALKAETKIPDSYKSGDEYIINALSVAASPDMQTEQTVIDILIPSQFDVNNCINEIYECVESDGRFTDYLMPYKADSLPNGAALTDISLLVPDGYANVWRASFLLDDAYYAEAYIHSINESGGEIAILFVNADGYKIVETGIKATLSNYYENLYPIAANSLTLDDYIFTQTNSHIKIYKYGKSTSQTDAETIDHLMLVYPDKSIKEYTGEEAHNAYYTSEHPSDDKRHLITEELNAIYLADGEEKELLLKITDEERGEGKFAEYRNWMFVDWFDDDRFICGITGYMGISEYFIYDLNTRTLTAFEPVDNTIVYGAHNGKIILIPNAMATDSSDVYEYDPDTNECFKAEGLTANFMEGSYSSDSGFFVSASHKEYPYGDFTVELYDLSKREIVKSLEGYLHHNRLGPLVYKDGQICGIIEKGPFTPTYYAVFE